MEKFITNRLELDYLRSGAGQSLVLLHGFPLDHAIWDDLIPHLQNDFDLIIPDLRGFGVSQTKDKEYTLDDMAHDMAALLHHLKINKVFVAGHSMGGYVALAFARLYPDLVLGLGLVASQAAADTPERQKMRYADAEQVEGQGVELLLGMAEKLSSNPHVQARVRPIILRQGAAGVAGALKAMAVRSDSTEFLSGFSKPLVVIHGEADMLIPPERARAIKVVVPHAVLTLLSDCGHMPMMEEPQTTADGLKKLK
jgi:3-oxoadipate enol-lactonase